MIMRNVIIRTAATSLILRVALSSLTACATGPHIEDPYKGVDWETVNQYKANLHTHTTRSDGTVDPSGVVDMYREHGYRILSLTDHDTYGPAATTWPWEDFGRNPDELGMIAIEGNEISRLHHIGSLYSDYGDPDVVSEEVIFEEISERNGLAIFNHPGRYTESEKPERKRFLEWYCDHLLRHPHILGLEIYNKNDRYPMDRRTWDAILTRLLPDRKVWGFANDDMHEPIKNFGYSWNIILLPELADASVREALASGRFFYAHSPKGKDGPPPPVIQRIEVDNQSGTIRIDSTGHISIDWIANGKVVHSGSELTVSDLRDAVYVRAVVRGAGGSLVGTQPFPLTN